MNTKYDCTEDVMQHKSQVKRLMALFAYFLNGRGEIHDDSKLKEPEKSMFDVWTPKLKEFEFGSDEYKDALKNMGEALKHHYEYNSHHPEHYANGIDDMDLFDLVEMFCDWTVAAKTKGVSIDLDYLQTRFWISNQLRAILENTMDTLESIE